MKPRVLIVDDSLTVRMDLQDTFNSIGLETTTCETLAAARQRLSKEIFSLVVLDVLLPDGDGVDLLREIKSNVRASSTRVILLSTEAEVRDRIRGLKTGADEYVGKPYDRMQLLARARQLVAVPESAGAVSGTRLLLIDDSLTFRNEFKAVLEKAGYLVTTAENGEEGLRTAVAMRPDAVVVNGVLPGKLGGAMVIRRLKDDIQLRDIPCLLLTATESSDDELRTYDAGADAYVRKGTDTELILARIMALLRTPMPHPTDSAIGGLLGPKRILTVDDSPTYLHELDEELRKEGYDVIPAPSGKEALELLEVQQVDCILLDLLMPDLSGQDTCRIIKRTNAWRSIPLLILTAVEEAEAMVEGINAGADDYIPKSSDFEVLKARVRAHLRRKQFEDEYRAMREKLQLKEIETAQARASQEIAETRAAFEPLLRNGAWLSNIVRIAHLGAWDWNLLDDTQHWSDEQFRIFGLTPGGLQPSYTRFLQAIHPDDRERADKIWQQARTDQRHCQFDCRLVTQEGETRYVICEGELFRDETGRAVRVIGTMFDISELKRAQELIELEAKRHTALVSTTSDGYWRFDRQGKLLDVNDTYCQMSGYKREELLSMHIADIEAIETPEEVLRHIQKVVQSGFVRFESKHRKKNAEIFDVEISACYFPATDEFLLFARDISRRRRAEEERDHTAGELRNLNEDLEHRITVRTQELVNVNRELEAFNYAIAHDLRGPLQHIDGFTTLLSEEAGPVLDSSSKQRLSKIQETVRHMDRLLSDLLDLSKLGRQEMRSEICGLGSLLAEVIRSLQADATGREVEWRINALPWVDCDSALIKQVLWNLVSNALKFSKDRHPAIIEIGQTTQDGEPVIFVRDNGVGFNMKYADNLFGVFQRLHRQEDFEGTGAGLAIVQRIINRHGGRVWAEAELNKGATFYFTLPGSTTEPKKETMAHTAV